MHSPGDPLPPDHPDSHDGLSPAPDASVGDMTTINYFYTPGDEMERGEVSR